MMMFAVLACALAQAPAQAPPPKYEPDIPARSERIRIGPRPRVSWPSAKEFYAEELATVFEGLHENRLGPLNEGSWEAFVAKLARMSVERRVGSKLETPLGLYTFQSRLGDVLVAQWTQFKPELQRGKVWLWDDPWSIKLVAEIDSALLNEEGALDRYCKQLLGSCWASRPISQGVSDAGIRMLHNIREDPNHRLSTELEADWTVAVADGSRAFLVTALGFRSYGLNGSGIQGVDVGSRLQSNKAALVARLRALDGKP